MKYIAALSDDFHEIGEGWKRYRDYLRSVRAALPEAVYEFALAEWHYSPTDHRSLHDAWVEQVALLEQPAASGRRLAMTVVALGPFHDHRTTLTYDGVTSYSLDLPQPAAAGKVAVGHGDWLIDEITLSAQGRIVHEILFSSGSRWQIECESFAHQCEPLPQNTPIRS